MYPGILLLGAIVFPRAVSPLEVFEGANHHRILLTVLHYVHIDLVSNGSLRQR